MNIFTCLNSSPSHRLNLPFLPTQWWFPPPSLPPFPLSPFYAPSSQACAAQLVLGLALSLPTVDLLRFLKSNWFSSQQISNTNISWDSSGIACPQPPKPLPQPMSIPLPRPTLGFVWPELAGLAHAFNSHCLWEHPPCCVWKPWRLEVTISCSYHLSCKGSELLVKSALWTPEIGLSTPRSTVLCTLTSWGSVLLALYCQGRLLCWGLSSVERAGLWV